MGWACAEVRLCLVAAGVVALGGWQPIDVCCSCVQSLAAVCRAQQLCAIPIEPMWAHVVAIHGQVLCEYEALG